MRWHRRRIVKVASALFLSFLPSINARAGSFLLFAIDINKRKWGSWNSLQRNGYMAKQKKKAPLFIRNRFLIVALNTPGRKQTGQAASHPGNEEDKSCLRGRRLSSIRLLMIIETRTADTDIVGSWFHCIRLVPVRNSYISARAIRVYATVNMEESWNREAVKKTVTDRSWYVHDVCHTGKSVNAATIVAAYSSTHDKRERTENGRRNKNVNPTLSSRNNIWE